MDYNKLNEEELRVIENKGTEKPFTGKYNDFYEEGTYYCKKCNTALYDSNSKFSSACGWPSFDDSLDSVKNVPDIDGKRVEIVCSNCNAHLGHVFEGERFTPKNVRHCVNSISLNFKQEEKENSKNINEAYFAGGCFWGVEYYFKKVKGVKEVISGYMGGDLINPTYEDICSGISGHLEVIKVQYNENEVSYEELCKMFFEIHDFTQEDGQGPDIGSQYLSAIFYNNEKEYKIAINLIDYLGELKYNVATTLKEVCKFYDAESYHQDYYNRHQKVPYCHSYKKIFS